MIRLDFINKLNTFKQQLQKSPVKTGLFRIRHKIALNFLRIDPANLAILAAVNHIDVSVTGVFE